MLQSNFSVLKLSLKHMWATVCNDAQPEHGLSFVCVVCGKVVQEKYTN